MLYRPSLKGTNWTLFTHDYDTVFSTNEFGHCSDNVFTYASVCTSIDDWNRYNPARYRVQINNNATFAQYMMGMIKAYFRSSDPSRQMPSVYLRFAELVYPWFARDGLQHFSFDHSAAGFQQHVSQTVALLYQRAANVTLQVQSALLHY